MLRINVIERSGKTRIIEANEHDTLMEALRESGVDELVALCGGSCSCATCHVYITSEDMPLPALGEDEDDLLDSSDARQTNSRLSCQIPLTQALDGITVVIAPDD